jgi:hypothetical protein
MSAPFDLVKQFDAMRQESQAPTSISSYLPPEMTGGLHSRTGTPDFSGMKPGGGQPDANGHFQGDGHDHSGGKGLVKYNGRDVSAGLRPHLDQIFKMFPNMRLTSGYRDAARNKRAGGVANSYHMRTGNSGAVDLVGTVQEMERAAALATQLGAKEVLEHNAGSGQHLHLAW